MDGPTFLLFYAGLVVTAILLARWFNHWRDPRSGEALPAVPSPADPYELAWLRGGAPEAIRLAVFDLKQAGMLATQTPESASSGAPHAVVAVGPLSESTGIAPLARMVLRACSTPQDATRLMHGALPQQVEEACTHWRVRHEDAGLLMDSGRRTQGWLLLLAVAGALALLSVARIQHALAGNFPFVFLVVLTFFGVVMLFKFGRPPQRLTARGGRYLNLLRKALAPNPAPVHRPKPPATDAESGTPLNSAATDVSHATAWSPATACALLPISLYGLGAMHPQERRDMQSVFPQVGSTPSAGGCGSSSSCGSASSCGSSDGGGGGGDGGGGGCGGCGGGGGD